MKPTPSNDRPSRVVQLDAPMHNEVQQLLPWLLTHRLEGAELARAQAHVADCARCQADLDWERSVQDRYAQVDTQTDAERGLAALMRQIEQPATAESPALGLWKLLRRRGLAALAAWQQVGFGWRAALLVQSAALVALAVALVVQAPAQPAADYHVLGTPSRASQANVVIRFRPDAQDSAMRRALHDSGARVVDGPTVSGAYLLDVPAAGRGAALDRLRSNSAVMLAESLE